LDAATGKPRVATEFGLAFIELGWEALDFAVLSDVYFRNIFQAFFGIFMFFGNFKNSQTVRRTRLY